MVTIKKFNELSEKLFEVLEEKGYEGLDVSIDESLMEYLWVVKQIDEKHFIVLCNQYAQEYNQFRDEDEIEPSYFFIDKVDEYDINNKWEEYEEDILSTNGLDENVQLTLMQKLKEMLLYGIVFHEIYIQYRDHAKEYMDLYSNDYCVTGNFIQLKDEETLDEIIELL